MLQIISAPNEVLSQQAKEITKIDGSLHNLIKEMKETLTATTDPEGVGLAAPQVGRSLQLFIIKPTPKSKEQIFINPIISLIDTDKKADEHGENQQESAKKSAKSKKEDTKLEGCLSLPTIWGEVKRAHLVIVDYLDEQGKPHTQTFSGFPAIIIQHECDHLTGILFPKRVLEQNNKLYKSHKEKGKDVFEEIEL